MGENTVLKINGVYSAEYLQGKMEGNRVMRVLNVRDTYLHPISPKTELYAPQVLRSRYLLTVRQSNGQCRQLYLHSLNNIKYQGWLRRILLWVKGVKV